MTASTALLALETTPLHFAYPGRPPALNGLTLAVPEGQRVGIIGPNGAGKSSLFLALCGVLKPDQGTVQVFGQPIQTGHFNPAIGLIFQNADDQLFSPTVREDLAFGPVNMGCDPAEVEARVAAALHLTGTEALLDRVPHHLSGGEKRMVAIASILTMHPRLVLYDEPDANLDMRARRRLIRLQQADHTLLIASHDLELILEVCNRLILMDGGCIIADGEPAQIMVDAALMEAHGLEKPHSLVPHAHLNGSAEPLR
ncbi:MAG: ABC transporter ATP-binding protein [Anaerolineae bacterium]|nr:ABC transporter ATP-binding protein [Anaerolineae bacterium]